MDRQRHTAVIGNVTFLASADPAVSRTALTDDDRFFILKSRTYLERCVEDFSDLGVANMVEAGVWQGGSVAWWNLALEPVNHLAFDLHDQQVSALERFADSTPSLTVAFGIDQGDADAVSTVVEQRFGGQPLDLVIDDCSHLYEPSRVMFEVLFPLLRPGGWYVIEDWPWSHVPLVPENSAYFAGRRGLSNLVVEALIVAADGGHRSSNR
jgi:Methyltransferase domain